MLTWGYAGVNRASKVGASSETVAPDTGSDVEDLVPPFGALSDVLGLSNVRSRTLSP